MSYSNFKEQKTSIQISTSNQDFNWSDGQSIKKRYLVNWYLYFF